MDRHTIAADGVQASILAQGAELCSLRDAAGRELLWQAGPAWPRHAPVLFPIVGRLPGDRLRHGGHDYRLTQHGFARDRRFEWTERTATSCQLTLRDDDATRALYPFAFAFTLTFSVVHDTLTVAYRATNTGNETLPVNMGAHPAFIWPLANGLDKSAHTLTFDAAEPEPMPRVAQGLLSSAIYPSVIEDRRLALDEALFAHDALILPQPHSRSVRYAAPGAPVAIEMGWDGFPSFGIWMRPGGDFLCLEPWHGMAAPADWDDVFATKPGLALLDPGQSLDAQYTVRLLPA